MKDGEKKEEQKLECKIETCKHRWTPLVKDPVTCPKCKSYSWKTGNKRERLHR